MGEGVIVGVGVIDNVIDYRSALQRFKTLVIFFDFEPECSKYRDYLNFLRLSLKNNWSRLTMELTIDDLSSFLVFIDKLEEIDENMAHELMMSYMAKNSIDFRNIRGMEDIRKKINEINTFWKP